MTSVAIIGAGMAGLTCARILIDKGITVTVFEKSRGVGGRLSTRRAEPFYFDHGVASFHASEADFTDFIKTLEKAGIVATWQPVVCSDNSHATPRLPTLSQETCYVGQGAMNAIGKYLATGLDIRLDTRVGDLKPLQTPGVGWQVLRDNGECLGEFDWVISAMPVVQANDFTEVTKLFGDLPIDRLVSASVLMLGFAPPLNLPWQVFELMDDSIAKIIINSDKPGRIGQQSVVIQTTAVWTDRHIDLDKQAAIQQLIEITSKVTGVDFSTASHKAIHHWRYANGSMTPPLAVPYLIKDNANLALCGDWCGLGDVQSAYLSGQALANRVMQSLNPPTLSTNPIY